MPIVPAGEVSAAECHDACRRYVALALEHKPGWRQRALVTTSNSISSDDRAAMIKEGDKIPLFSLHYAAVILLGGAGVAIGTHAMHSGVLLGYPPAILCMTRMALKRGQLQHPQFEPTKEALQRLVASSSSSSTPSTSAKSSAKKPGHRGSTSASKQTITDDGSPDLYIPDTLTAMGLAHAKHGTTSGDDRALRFFGLASLAASAGTAPWEWRASAALGQAAIHEKRGERERARLILGAAVRERDTPDLCYAYARLLDEGDPERWRMMVRAAVNGVLEAAREVGRDEWRRLQEIEEAEAAAAAAKEEGGGEVRGLSERQKYEARFLADEWLAIAAAGDKGVA